MKHFLLAVFAVFGVLSSVASPAYAADADINLDIQTPPTAITRHAMAQRHSRLVRFYESGEIGLAADGLLYIRPDVTMNVAKRQIAEKLLDAENAERKTLVFVIADGNGRRDAQAEVWTKMRERWYSQFKSGWWVRNAQGVWSQKP